MKRIVLFILLVAGCSGADFGGSGAKAPGEDGADPAEVEKNDQETSTTTESATQTETATTTVDGTSTVTTTETANNSNTDAGTDTGTSTQIASDSCGTYADILKGSARAMKTLADGSMLLAGSGRNPATTFDDAVIWKFKPDLTLDTAYATGGKFSLDLGNNNAEFVTHLEPLPGGGVIANFSGTMVKLDAAGARDNSFTVTGTVKAFAEVVANTYAGILSDDRVFKFDATGSVDAGFGAGGYVTIPDADLAQAVAAGGSGKILVLVADYQSDSPTGYNWPLYHLKLTRLNSDGSLDNTFGAAGVVTMTDLAPLSVSGGITALKVLDDGQIVVTNYVIHDPNPSSPRTNAVVYLFGSDGAPVNTFGTSGRFTADFGAVNNYDHLDAVDEFPDGSLLFSGWMMSGNQDHLLARMDRTATPVAPINLKKVPLAKKASDYLYAVEIDSATAFRAAGTACSYVYVAKYNEKGEVLSSNQP